MQYFAHAAHDAHGFFLKYHIQHQCITKCLVQLPITSVTPFSVQGRLLQLRLPCEVRPDSSKAERSAATGHLLLTMPKEDAATSAADLANAR